MTLRKIAGLLAVSGLLIGLVGSGVGAAFSDQVVAQENISVGTFSCQIISGDGTIGNSPHTGSTITYTAGPILSSAAGNAPFTFTVKNFGSINQSLTITASAVGGTLNPAKFSAMTLAPASPVALAAGASQAFNTGIQWAALDNTDLGDSGSVTWTVDCNEAPSVIFDNTPAVLPGNLPSIGPEAYSYNEFGAQVQFAGTARKLSTATVTMSSWACQSGAWYTANCVSAPGATFNVPITFKIYNVGPGNTVGSLVASKTQTFAIPYRPSTDSVNCTGGRWYNGTTCFNGLANNIVFTFAGETLPNAVIFGISFNTSNHGYAPLGGSGSPTDSLNVAMYPGTGDGSTAVAPAIGTWLPDGKSAYLNSTHAPFYLDGGAGGTGTFRLDTGSGTASSIGPYGGYEPAVQIVANN